LLAPRLIQLTSSPDFRPKAYGLDVDSIETLLNNGIRQNPSITLELMDIINEIDGLKTERDTEKERIRQFAAAEEALLISQVSAVKERRAGQLQEIETVYTARLGDARSRCVAILSQGSETYIGAGVSSSHTSTFDSGARAESQADSTTLNASSQTSDISGPSPAFQMTMQDLDAPNVYPQQSNDTASLHPASQPSSDPDFSNPHQSRYFEEEIWDRSF
jgi:hypothetical protein